MKSLHFYFLALCIALAIGCKKDTTTATVTTTIPTDGWYVGTKTYKQNLCARDTTNLFTLTALSYTNTQAQGEGWAVVFGSYPKSNGTYTLAKNYLKGSGIGATELVPFTFSYNNAAITNTYVATSADAPPVQATVTITNSKVKVVLPECWVKSVDLTVQQPVFNTDSLKLSGTMIEN